MKKFLTCIVPLVLLAVYLLCSVGCTTRGDAGTLLRLGFDVAVGEDASAVTTAGDETEAGKNVTSFRPTPEATTETPRRGFPGLEVNRD